MSCGPGSGLSQRERIGNADPRFDVVCMCDLEGPRQTSSSVRRVTEAGAKV
jgi:hypothetical protein